MISPRGLSAACLLLWCPAPVGDAAFEASAPIDAPARTGASEGCP